MLNEVMDERDKLQKHVANKIENRNQFKNQLLVGMGEVVLLNTI